MTLREFLTAIIDSDSNLDMEIIDYANEALRKLDEQKNKRTSQPSKKSIENIPLTEKVKEYLSLHQTVPAREIAEALEMSTAKVSALLRPLVGTEVRADVMKIGKYKANVYTLITE